ncbi:MAG: hypothetical protein WCC60_22745, partial [Ilumatobacteraceae bacterium]
MDNEQAHAARPGRLMLWPGHGLYVGPLLPNAPHAHHAIQITAALTGSFSTVTTRGTRRSVAVAVVDSDEPHALHGIATSFQLYLDPGSWPGRLGHDANTDQWQRRLANQVRAQLPTLRRLWDERAPLEDWRPPISRITEPGDRPDGAAIRRVDSRVTEILRGLHAAPAEPPSLADAAMQVHLSPGRFGHLFTEGTGLPYRRYQLWV